MPSSNSAPPTQGHLQDEIDLRELLLALWNKKRVLAASAVSGLVLASIYAFLIAKPSYESTALLLPTQTVSTDQLGAAAALLGKKPTGGVDMDLYQGLLTSRKVLRKLLNAPITNLSDTGNGKVEPLHTTLGLSMNKPLAVDDALQVLEKSIKVESKESGAGGILVVKFKSTAPWLSQQIGNHVLAIGQEELRLVRIQRSSVIMERLDVAVAQARDEWDQASVALTQYKVRNRSIVVPEQMLELSRLETERSAKEQKYLLARKEYELQQLEKSKAAPPMMVFDEADLPVRKSKPRKLVILAAGLFLGLFGGIGGVLGWKMLFEGAAAPRPNTAG